MHDCAYIDMNENMFPAGGDTSIPVSELARRARLTLERSFPVLWVGGELSGVTRAASGHLYFSLKDETAQVRCVMFRNRSQLLPFEPKAGLRVEVRAQVSLYEARGDFQLTVDAMRRSGVGALHEAFRSSRPDWNAKACSTRRASASCRRCRYGWPS